MREDRSAGEHDLPLDPFVHEAVFYGSDDEYLAILLPFIRAGIEAREPVLVAVPGDRLDVLADELGPAMVDIRVQDMRHAGRNPGRIIPWVLHPFVEEHTGQGPVRLVGEPIWAGRSDLEYPACVQHEAAINLAFGGRNATVLCPYDVHGLDSTALADAVRTHPVLTTPTDRRDSGGYRGARDIIADYNRPCPPAPDSVEPAVFGEAALPEVRGYVGRQAAVAGLATRRTTDLQLAVNELADNAVTHGGGRATIRIWPADGGVYGEVTDDGTAAASLIGRTPPAVDTEHGRGLALVNYLCDLVRVYAVAGCTAVRVFMRY